MFRFDVADSQSDIALRLARFFNDVDMECRVLINKASNYFLAKKYDEYIKTCKLAYQLNGKYETLDFLLMYLYYCTNNLSLASKYHYKLSIKCKERKGYHEYWVEIFNECYEYSRTNKKASEQIYVLDALIECCKEHNMHEERAHYLEIMVSYFRK